MVLVPAQETPLKQKRSEAGSTERVNVQKGAERYAGLFEQPQDPWNDEITWVRVLAAPTFVIPGRAIIGFNQAAVFLQLNLIEEKHVVTDGDTWTGIEEMPGDTRCHAAGTWAWLSLQTSMKPSAPVRARPLAAGDRSSPAMTVPRQTPTT